MRRSRSRYTPIIAAALWLAGGSPAVSQSTQSDTSERPPPDIGELPAGPFATLGMKLEKTFLKVDVLALTVRVDPLTAERLGSAVEAREYDRELEPTLAELAISPSRAIAEIEFLRGVSLDQFLGGIDDDMEKATEAGWLDPPTHRMLADSLPVWFEFLEQRRIEDGDRLSYEVRGDTLRTVFWGTREGQVLLDQTDVGRQHVLALLGAYFAPGSSFRRDLIRSLWWGWDPENP